MEKPGFSYFRISPPLHRRQGGKSHIFSAILTMGFLTGLCVGCCKPLTVFQNSNKVGSYSCCFPPFLPVFLWRNESQNVIDYNFACVSQINYVYSSVILVSFD